MTPEEVRRRVSEIRRGAADPKTDDEQLHWLEDQLHHTVLMQIAEGRAEDPQALAREAIETLKISFFRWGA